MHSLNRCCAELAMRYDNRSRNCQHSDKRPRSARSEQARPHDNNGKRRCHPH